MIVRDAPSSLPTAPVETVMRARGSRRSRSRMPQWVAYLVAITGAVAVGVGDAFFPALFASFPFVVSAVVVVIAAGVGGFGPGLLATVCGAITGAVFLSNLSDTGPSWWVTVHIGLFVVFGVLISVLNAARLRATDGVTMARGELFALLHAVRDGIVLEDPARGVVFANDAVAHLVGNAVGGGSQGVPAQILTERFEFVDGQGHDVPATAFFGGETGKGVGETENVFAVRDRITGESRWWSIWGTTLAPARKGETHATATFFRDVTPQRQAESALATSDSRLRTLIAHSADAFVLLDQQGGVLFSSPAVSTILGYREDELRGVNAFSLVHSQDVARATRLVTASRNVDAAPLDTFRLRHHDGRWRWIEATGSDLLNDPAVRAVLLNLRDISDQKRAEDALTTSERRFRILLAHTTDAVIVTDLSGEILYASPATEQLLGHHPDAFAAMDTLSHVHPADVTQARAFFQALVRESEAHAVIAYRMRHRDGTYRWVEITATNRLDDPAVRGIVGNYRDITERTREVIRQRFLQAANIRFATAVADEDTLTAITGTAVPEFAAGCAVEVRDTTGRLRRSFTVVPAGGSVGDPDLFATTPVAAYVARALITGQPALFTPTLPTQTTASDESGAGDLARPVSMLVAPLIAQGVTFGAVTFVAPGEAPFALPDRQTAEIYAGRLALALVQTRLFAEAGDAQTRYRMLFESLPDAALIIDRDGNYTDANRAFTDLLGYTLEEVRQSRIGAFTAEPERDIETFTTHRGMERWYAESDLVRKDGVRISVAGWTAAMQPGDEMSILYLVIWRPLPE